MKLTVFLSNFQCLNLFISDHQKEFKTNGNLVTNCYIMPSLFLKKYLFIYWKGRVREIEGFRSSAGSLPKRLNSPAWACAKLERLALQPGLPVEARSPHI